MLVIVKTIFRLLPVFNTSSTTDFKFAYKTREQFCGRLTGDSGLNAGRGTAREIPVLRTRGYTDERGACWPHCAPCAFPLFGGRCDVIARRYRGDLFRRHHSSLVVCNHIVARFFPPRTLDTRPLYESVTLFWVRAASTCTLSSEISDIRLLRFETDTPRTREYYYS